MKQRGDTAGRLSMPIGHGVFLTIGNAGAGKSTPDVKLKVGGNCGETQSNSADPMSSRKASLLVIQERPYRKPTLVGEDKCPQVLE